MPAEQTVSRSELLALAGEIVATYMVKNTVGGSDLPPLIQAVLDRLIVFAGDAPP